MLRITIVIIAGLLLTPNAYAIEVITGHVQDETGAPIIASVTVNGKQVTTTASGDFSVLLKNQGIYQLSFSADGFYPAVHTFSQYELATSETSPNQIPSVILVAKKKGRSLMVFGGDAMMGRRFSKPFAGEPVLVRPDNKPADTKAILMHMKPYLGIAEFASVNLETQVIKTEPTSKAPKSVTFFTSPETIEALQWAGVDYVTLGNNHTYDYLDKGLNATLGHLQQQGMAYSGAGLTETDALKSYEAALNDNRYAFQGYVGWAGSAKPSQVAEGDTKGGPPLGSYNSITATVTRDGQQGLLPIVQYHGSLEYGEEPSLDTETRLKGAIDAGAVMALGHHPHVYQGLEVYKGKLIAWSLGNFTFDQYFYTAQKSALLYVWMDGADFHRAEVVPIYLKGYVPTPATGEMRHSILKRIAMLSARRGTYMSASGGHAVVQPGLIPSYKPTVLKFNRLRLAEPDEAVYPLTNLPWNNTISTVENSPKNKQFRFGKDLLSRGDFEDHYNFGSPDRSWLDLASNISVNDAEAFSGSRSLEVEVPSQNSVETGMRKFTRGFKPGSPSTITAMVKSEEAVTVVFSIQKRGTRDGLNAALENNPKIELERLVTKPGDWQQVAVDFTSPRVGARSFRVLIEVQNANGETATVYIDNIALVEWQTPFLDRANSTAIASNNNYSHIQFEQRE